MRLNENFYIIRISKKLQKEKRNKLTVSTAGYLGIKYSEESNAKGFIVLLVEDGSPAFKAGFKPKDIITAINGEKVTSFDDMLQLVTKHPPGAEIEISFINALAFSQSTISKKKVTLGEKPLSLDVPANSQDFRFNLQFGEIVEMGKNVAEIFPEAVMGDILIVHHLVEYKERAENDINWNDWHLLEDDENYEYRFVQAMTEVLGVWRPNETDVSKSIIPFPLFVFCHPQFQKAAIQLTASGIWIPEAWEQSMETLQEKLEDLKAQIQELNTNIIMQQQDNEENYRQKDLLKKAIDSINEERRLVTRKMHQIKMVDARVVFVNERTKEEYGCDIKSGETIIADYSMLYPLDLMGSQYVLVRAPYIVAIKN